MEIPSISPAAMETYQADDIAPVQVGPGCLRRDLPSTTGVRSWIVDIAAGAQWPHVDHHDEGGEIVYVVSGELIEGEKRYGPGTYIVYSANSKHQPRSERGVRLFGFNTIRAVA